MIDASDLRANLEDAFDEAQAANPVVGLRAKLREKETDARKLLSGGSLTSVAGAGGRQSGFAPYAEGNLTSLETARMWRQLVDLFDRQKDALGEGASDEQVFDAMMAALPSTQDAIVETSSDWSCAGPR